MLLCSSSFNHSSLSSVHYLFICLKSNRTKSNILNTILKPLSFSVICLERWSIANKAKAQCIWCISTRESDSSNLELMDLNERGGIEGGEEVVRSSSTAVSQGTTEPLWVTLALEQISQCALLSPWPQSLLPSATSAPPASSALPPF